MEQEKDPKPAEKGQACLTGPLSDEEQVELLLEQARQEVKKMAQKEREGEKINRELLNFRMR